MKNWRFYTLVFFVGLIFAIIIFRLFSLQILRYGFYRNLAAGQHQIFQEIVPARGEIFMKDRFANSGSITDFFPAAINKSLWKVYAVPKNIETKEETVQKLSPLLGVKEEILMEKISKPDDPYEPLANKINDEIAEKIKVLNLEGIDMEKESWRYFPVEEMASHLIGFVGYDSDKKIGRYGLEEYYEKELAGRAGLIEARKDSTGEIISVAGKIIQEPEDGADLILTIDPNIQFFVEKKLKETIEWLSAEKGTIIVMEVKTGAIKAMANWPSFNPNEYNQVKDIILFKNPAIQEVFEPGSIFKPITMAGALDKGAVSPNTTYEDKGRLEMAGYVIKNALDRVWGIQTMTEVLEKSLNTGAVFAQQKLGKEDFKKYVEKFGFDEKTDIDLKGEVKGNISNLNKKRDLEYATASFGQGISVTSIQLIFALAAIANDGVLMRPYVVEKIIYSDKKEKITKPEQVRRVISSDTASRLTAMLVSVIKNGYGKKAGVKGYLIAGKTGTAQIPDFQTGGYSDEVIHTFGGFFPALDSRFAVFIKIDKPRGINFAADSVAPVFNKIAEYILNYYEIPPSQ